jgi:hypothetical protein
MSLFSAGVINYWARQCVDQTNSMEISYITKELLTNSSLLPQNQENKEETKISLGQLTILLNIIGACAALSFIILIYEIVDLKMRKK